MESSLPDLRLFWKIFGIKNLNDDKRPLSADTEQVSNMLIGEL